LRRTALEGRGVAGLEALWAWYGCAGFDPGTFERLLRHPNADIRAWSVRLIGDEPQVPARLAVRLAETASSEPDVAVRAQLACTARRLEPGAGLDVAYRLLRRNRDGDDPHLPLLLWWAVERHTIAGGDHAIALFTAPDAWRSAMIRSTIQGPLVRRYALEASPAGEEACARLLASAPSVEARRPLLAALDEAMRGRGSVKVAPGLAREVIGRADRDPRDVTLTRLAARLGSRPASERARVVADDRRSPEPDRLAMIDLLGDLEDQTSLGLLLDLARNDSTPSSVRSAALGALGRFEDESIARALLATYPRQVEAWRSQVRELLLSRASWARDYLAAVDRGALPAQEVTLDQLGRFAALQAPDLAALVRKHWGATRGATREERLAEVRRLNNDLRAAPGDPARGRRLFLDRCAICHRLHGEGETIGPDLTYANRQDRDFLLVSLVDPSGVVRKEYQAYNVATTDGRVLSGLIVEQTPEMIVLRDAKGQRTRVAAAEVQELKEADVSLMPESLSKELTPEQLRDLFSYLQR
jgi:putative heme-binding domain-containing protein